jgi:hypothetical protein
MRKILASAAVAALTASSALAQAEPKPAAPPRQVEQEEEDDSPVSMIEQRPDGVKPITFNYHNQSYYYPNAPHPIYFENERMAELGPGETKRFLIEVKKPGVVVAWAKSAAFTARVALLRTRAREVVDIQTGETRWEPVFDELAASDKGSVGLYLDSGSHAAGVSAAKGGSGMFEASVDYYPANNRTLLLSYWSSGESETLTYPSDLPAGAPRIELAPDVREKLLKEGLKTSVAQYYEASLGDGYATAEFALTLPAGMKMTVLARPYDAQTPLGLRLLDPARGDASAKSRRGQTNDFVLGWGALAEEGSQQLSFETGQGGDFVIQIGALSALDADAPAPSEIPNNYVSVAIEGALVDRFEHPERLRVYRFPASGQGSNSFFWHDVEFRGGKGLGAEAYWLDENLSLAKKASSGSDSTLHFLSDKMWPASYGDNLASAPPSYLALYFNRSEYIGYDLIVHLIDTQGDAPLPLGSFDRGATAEE